MLWILFRTTSFRLMPYLIFTSCSVVKTPYFKTDYYKQTVSRLDSLKPQIKSVNDTLYAGFSRISITPDLSKKYDRKKEAKQNIIPLAGYGNRRGKPAEGIHDSIFVKAVALKTGNQTLVLVSGDILIMPPNIIDEAVIELSEEGIRRDQLFFAATHSHSSIGGWGYGLMAKAFAGKENKNLEKWLISQIRAAVINAMADLMPAKLGSGSFNASPYTRNRLTGNQETINKDFSFIVIEQFGGRKAVIGSFSSHATTLGRTNMLISGDYPGYWQRKIEASYADIALFCAGSTGSQSPVGKGDEFDNAKYIGESLADSVLVHLKSIRMIEKSTVSSLSLKLNLPEYHIRLTTNKNITSGLSNRLMPLPKNVYLQTLSLNNLMWVFTPGDFSGESALIIKKLLAGKNYEAIISGYNGSYIGYIMPGKYFYLDHYESKLMGWFGPTMGDYAMELIERMNDSIIEYKGPFYPILPQSLK
ncbi:MAG: neutral/alkaline non-lysosomal ceramidase N-terminal domain-containing protein [Bacteroidales bacterium]|nr:neutral/alkaline non-lysosomal ceramidase N-terminal domain-containing protein [Bacteroidales bacterium]